MNQPNQKSQRFICNLGPLLNYCKDIVEATLHSVNVYLVAWQKRSFLNITGQDVIKALSKYHRPNLVENAERLIESFFHANI